MQIHEPARDIPVVHECDICVIGGSCTGVFAALAAARRGARVAIIERMGQFGGMATTARVALWHSLYNLTRTSQVIGGLTQELLDRLEKQGAAEWRGDRYKADSVCFNPDEMAMELDRLVGEASIRPFLHARFCAPVMDGERLDAVIIEDKSGRRAIRAEYFVDATGDADVAFRMGLSTRTPDRLQPPTTVVTLQGLQRWHGENPDSNLAEVVFDSKIP